MTRKCSLFRTRQYATICVDTAIANDTCVESDLFTSGGAQVSDSSSNSMSSVSLPPELLDKIFGFVLYDDTKILEEPFARRKGATIFACSLVSKDWRDLTLRHRFSSMHVHTPLDAYTLSPDGVISASVPSLDTVENRINKLPDFLHSRPLVCTAVHTLVLHYTHWNSDPTCFVHILPLLPRLHTLELVSMTAPSKTLSMQPVLQSLDCLIIRDGRFWGENLLSFLGIFRHIGHLYLVSTELHLWGSDSDREHSDIGSISLIFPPEYSGWPSHLDMLVRALTSIQPHIRKVVSVKSSLEYALDTSTFSALLPSLQSLKHFSCKPITSYSKFMSGYFTRHIPSHAARSRYR